MLINNLALNLDKTNFVLFHSPQTSIAKPVRSKFGIKQIDQEKYNKSLGVLFDEHLTWKITLKN